MTNINRPVLFSCERGIVIAEAAGSRGKTLCTIRLASGREIRQDLRRVEFRDVPVFSEPTGVVVFDAELRAELRDAARLNRI
jgi:hypothetical protein